MAEEQQNQQEQMAKQTAQYAKKAFGGLDDIAKGTGQVAGGVGKVGLDLVETVGEVSKAPGAVVEVMASDVGEWVKVPGAMVQGVGSGIEKATDAIGDALNKPGDLIQNAAERSSQGINKAADFLGDKTEGLLGKGAGDIVRGTGSVVAGVGKAYGDLVGGVLKAPGTLLKGVGDLTKGVGDFAGAVLKAPGELIKGAGKLAGGILKAPGELLKGIANGVENIIYNTDKEKTYTDLTKEKAMAGIKPNVQTTQVFIDKLKAGGDRWLDGNQLEKLDNFSENMDKLANGKIDKQAPFSNILTLPKEQRAEAVKEATLELRDNLKQISKDLVQNPERFTPQQRAEMGLIMKGINAQGGIDQYMQKHFDLQKGDGKSRVAEPEKESSKENAQAMINKTKTGLGKGVSVGKKVTMDAEQDVKPVLSGTAAPKMSSPTKGLSVGGRD